MSPDSLATAHEFGNGLLVGLSTGVIAGALLGFATAFVLMAIRELPPDPAPPPPRVLPFPLTRPISTHPRLPS